MNKNIKFLLIASTFLFSILGQTLLAQNNLDSLLNSVAQNNPSLIAYQNLINAKTTQAKTGLYPENPSFEYDWMQGTPQNAGNQTDITVVQTLDFPTVYSKKTSISKLTIEQLKIEAKGYQQSVLLKAKQLYLELIYWNQQNKVLTERMVLSKQLVERFEKSLKEGNSTQLEFNKAKLHYLKIQSQVTTCKNHQQTNQKLLTQLNGGKEVVVNENIYPLATELPRLDSIFSLAKEVDYKFKALEIELEKSEEKIGLEKALALPKLEAGYRHQAILGQQFNGFHAGVSIPLFENRNKVTTAKNELIYYQSLEQSHISEHHAELELLYEAVINLKEILNQYKAAIEGSNSEEILQKAFEAGEISFIDFHKELTLLQSTQDDYLKTKYDYQIKLSELMKYNLETL